MNPRCYIPSRGRWGNVHKLVKAWENEIFDVVFIVEPHEVKQYQNEIPDNLDRISVDVIENPPGNIGVGYCRQVSLEHAAESNLDSYILSDDDIKPMSGMDYLIDTAADPMVLGVNSWYGYLDLVLGLTAARRKELGPDILIAPSCLTRIFGMNVKNSMALGGFDRDLKVGEDADYVMRGIQAGYPWLIHLGAKSASIGHRFASGGVAALEDSINPDNENGQGQCYRDAVVKMVERYPGYTKATTPVRLRYQWKKFIDDYLPDWREWSVLHGGDIKNYMGASWEG